MTDFAPERPGMRSRGPSLPKLNLLPASHFLQQQHPHYTQPQHPFDTTQSTDAGIDIDLDMDMGFDTTPSKNKGQSEKIAATATAQRPFVSAHPSPDVSDESDCERLGRTDDDAGVDAGAASSLPADDPFGSLDSAPFSAKQLQRDQTRRQQSRVEPPLSHHIFLAPVPIPSASRTPPHSPQYHRQRSSFSLNTPPGSATSVLPAPCSDAIAVDMLIRKHVHASMLTHATDKAFFWQLGKLSEFSFSDRFVRSRVFEINDSANADANANATAIADAATTSDSGSLVETSSAQGASSSWRLRLYPHGRGDRHRDSDYVGLYLQQEGVRVAGNRRASAISPAANFSSSVPTHFTTRGSICSSAPRKSISGASSLPAVRRHVTLFIATENGDCLAKQDLVEWFSGSEGGLGFPRIVSRKIVQDAVKTVSMMDDDEEESELSIVAGVLFHEL
ncbi:hypothetical protein EDD11_002837 [Mortierella claussenii]|nr:hypothetical protein EDD11_002837 [Mortierella claussenii]